jgi:hypothetical protein
MTKLTFYVLTLFMTFRSLGALADNNDSTLVEQDFTIEVKEKLERTKLQSASALSNDFLSNWVNGTLSDGSKDHIAAIGSVMKERNLPAIPYYFNFISLVNNVAQGQLGFDKSEKLFKAIDKGLYSLDNQDFYRLIIYLNDFLQYHTIYNSKYYRLYVSSQDFDIEFIGEANDVISAIDTGSVSADTVVLNRVSGSDWGQPVNDTTTLGGNDQWGGFSSGNNDSTQAVPGVQSENDNASDALLPAEKGIIIKFDLTDLVFVTPYDSSVFSSTSGSWMVNDLSFLGKGGSYDWSHSGYPVGEVITTLDKYYFKVDRPGISAENVTLQYPGLVNEPVKGIFDFFNTRPDREGNQQYPKFIAYNSNHVLKIAADNSVKVTGGLAIYGKKISTHSLSTGNTLVEIGNETGRRIQASGSVFNISDSILFTQNSSLTIFQGQDSICHPAVEIHYDFKNRKFLAEKSRGQFRDTPFLASYFKMEITADAIEWDLNSDSLSFFVTRARNIVPASFISYDYFDPEYLRSLSRAYRFNPLLLVVNYSKKMAIDEFTVDDLASFSNQSPVAIRSGMILLMENNFISFDKESGVIKVKNKAYQYAYANKGIIDSDELLINSVSGAQKNALLDLSKNQLNIRGIKKFYISQVLDVYILPDSDEITVLNNRDLKFDGRLFAGNFEFVGRDFLFKYDSFYVDLTNIDSIRFYIDDPKTGQKVRVDNKLVAVDTAKAQALSDLSGQFDKTTGRLFINMPDNKSGRKIYPGYPTFNAARGAIVYFNSPQILNGAYDQSVYFVIPPFKIDSLSDSDPATIGFEGKFYSGGLLPPFNETLHVMPDNSLGFDHDIAPEGYQLYEGNGRVYNHLHVDKSGITANGNIKYLTTSLNSDKLTFYMDSLAGTGSGFKMKEGELNNGSFPDASIEKFRMKWLPKKDSMYITNLDKPFSLYNSTASLNGELNINRKGAYGKGNLETRKSKTSSNDFFFNKTKFAARNAEFTINSNDPVKPILAGEDIKLFFNLSENYADIGPEVEGVAAINFPYAEFKTSIPTMRWYLDKRTVEMQKPTNIDIASSYFYATRKDLDSLVFNAASASYNIDNFQLLIKGIPFIKVADAKIIPENNQVLVLENARIGTLKNTDILIDTINQYHSLYNGTIDIISRNKFSGSATYRLVNAVKDTFAVRIDNFDLVKEVEKDPESPMHTKASGFINEADKVVISPGMMYKGKAIMYAPDPAFALDGEIKLQYRQNPQKEIWIKYTSSQSATQDVKIDFKSARTEFDEPVTAGIHFDQNNQLYSTYVNSKKSVMDADFFIPDGILSFDADSSTYKIEDTLKMAGDSFMGKIFDLNIKSNQLDFEGPVNFNINSKGIELKASGVGKGNILDNKYSMDAFLTVDFQLPSQAPASIAAQIINEEEKLNLSQAYTDDPSLLYKVSELIGEPAAEDYQAKSQVTFTPLVSASARLQKTISISGVNLSYDIKKKAWYSSGKIGLSNIGRQDLNVLTDGFVEIKKSDDGDMVNIFFQFSPDIWYYFNFEQNRLLTVSSNGEFNDIIAGKSKVLKANFGEYFFLNGETQDAMNFVKRFRQDYEGNAEPFNLITPEQPANDAKTDKNKKTGEPKTPKEAQKEEKKDDDGF